MALQNLVVPWSEKQYGPDGPWQAVKIFVGGTNPNQRVEYQHTSALDVFPGSDYSSATFSLDACRPFSDSNCSPGGTWDSSVRSGVQWPFDYDNKASGLRITQGLYKIEGITINSRTVWNASIVMASNANITYPDGTVHGPTLGNLALGADETFQRFDTRAGTDAIKAWIYPGFLYDNKELPSYSFGLHIGSAALRYPGSLVFGGFNKGRVIGPTTIFTTSYSVQLLDIGIGLGDGASPFGFDSQEGLLLSNTSKPGAIPVFPDPLSPYLSLPDKTCEAIAAHLPVRFDNNLKYYLWNIEDPNFGRIVSSPAYLSFSFPPAPGESDNVVVKVPFKLLNLTLEPPITQTSTQYFPCLPYNPLSGGNHILGRAFLQAAFVGRNWKTRTSWLGQAPGPGAANVGLGDQNTNIADDATTIETFNDSGAFNQSWAGHWTVLNEEVNTSATAPSPAPSESSLPSSPVPLSHHLSTGATAGIGVGVSLAVLAIVGAFAYWHRRRNESPQNADSMEAPVVMSPETKHTPDYIGSAVPGQLPHFSPYAVEMPNGYHGEEHLRSELSSTT